MLTPNNQDQTRPHHNIVSPSVDSGLAAKTSLRSGNGERAADSSSRFHKAAAMPATAPERPLTLSPNASATPRVCGMRNRPSRLAGQSPEGKVLGDECQARIAKLTGTQ